jgi:sulfate adenylyltransferase subunit 1 (EFTu-like GTPase family)
MARGRKKKAEMNGTSHEEEPLAKGEFQEPLSCVLTDQEHTARSMSLADVDKRIDTVDLERREVAKGYSTQLKQLREERAPLIEAVETRKETRMVRCREVHNFERNNVTIIRLDTQETVRERAMEAEELDAHRQPGMFNDGPPAEA